MIFKMVNKLRAGVVWANTYNEFDPTSPSAATRKRLWSRGRTAGAGSVLSGGLSLVVRGSSRASHSADASPKRNNVLVKVSFAS